MKFGYARVSTTDQNLDLQIDALTKYGVDQIYREKVSTKAASRPELTELLKILRAGDTLVIWKLDRLGRTVKQLTALAEEFESKGIHFVSLQESLDTTTAMGKFCFHIFCAAAQMERDIISERTLAGLAAARARGRQGGRKPIENKKIDQAIKMYNTKEFSIKEIIDSTGVAKSTLYKYLNIKK